MKNNIENIPSELFDWLSSKSFEQLDSQQKEVVLQYFTIDEYNELAATTNEINTVMRPNQNYKQQTKVRLMNKFEEVFPQPMKRFTFPRFMRYAAMVILSIGLGYQLHFWMQSATKNQTVFQHIVDTVYVYNNVVSASTVLPEVKDSLPAKVASTSGSQVNRKKSITPVSEKKIRLNFNVVSVQDAKNMANIPKGNNCKSDSLRRKFTYVSL